MARSAEAMVTLTIWQIFVGAEALFGLAITIFYTRETAKAAVDAAVASSVSAKAARDANKLNRQAMQAQQRATVRQLRAYMHVSSAAVREVSPGDRIVSLGIKNYGQTPAYDVVTRAVTKIQKWPLEVGLADPPDDLPAAVAPFPPGGETVANIQVPTANSFEERELQDGRAAIYCWGVTRYKVPVEEAVGAIVISHRIHETRFIMACRGDGLATGKMHAIEKGNSAT